MPDAATVDGGLLASAAAAAVPAQAAVTGSSGRMATAPPLLAPAAAARKAGGSDGPSPASGLFAAFAFNPSLAKGAANKRHPSGSVGLSEAATSSCSLSDGTGDSGDAGLAAPQMAPDTLPRLPLPGLPTSSEYAFLCSTGECWPGARTVAAKGAPTRSRLCNEAFCKLARPGPV